MVKHEIKAHTNGEVLENGLLKDEEVLMQFKLMEASKEIQLLIQIEVFVQESLEK